MEETPAPVYYQPEKKKKNRINTQLETKFCCFRVDLDFFGSGVTFLESPGMYLDLYIL